MIFIFDIYLKILSSMIKLLGKEDEGGDVLPIVFLRHLHSPLCLVLLPVRVVEDGRGSEICLDLSAASNQVTLFVLTNQGTAVLHSNSKVLL